MKKINLILTGGFIGISATALALSFDASEIALVRNVRNPQAVKATATSESVIPKAPLREEVYSPRLYAYSLLGYNSAPTGMFETSLDGRMTHMWNPAEAGYHLRDGWMHDGNFCGILTHNDENGEFDVIRYQEYDLTTGEVLSTKDLDGSDYMNWFTQCTFLPDEKVVFGVGRDDRNWECVKTMSIDDFSDIKILYETDWNESIVAICYNPIDRNVYAITIKGVFVKIDKTTGEYETLYELPIPEICNQYNQALVYLPSADEYLFAACMNDGDDSTNYYRIDLAEKKTIKSATLANCDFVSCFITMDQGDMESPSRPRFQSMNFPQGSRTGSVSFTLPDTDISGNALTGNLTWMVDCDGVKVAEGTGAPGGDINAEITLPDGSHVLEMRAVYGNHSGPSTKAETFIGYDTPQAPANVVLEAGKVSWDAVTAGVNGGYINLDDMTYEVYVDDAYIGETEGTSIEFDIDADVEFKRHRADVRAISGDIESESGYSNYCLFGSPMTLDVTFTPTEEESTLFTTVTEDPNVFTWGWEKWESALATSVPSADSEAWLVTPPLRFDDAGKIYSLSFESKSVPYIGGDCQMTVYLGTSMSPQDMTKVIVNSFTPSASSYDSSDAVFTVPESGTYYIGFLVKAANRSCSAYLKNIAIRLTDISSDGPGDCTDLVAIPGEKGALSATVTFNMPSRNLLDNPYDGDTEVTAEVTCGENSRSVKGKVGSQQSVEFTTVQGSNDISVTCCVDGNKGSTVKTSVFTGIDAPTAPRNFRATLNEDNRTVKFTWEAPDKGASGNWFEPTGITYKIGVNNGWWGIEWFEEEYVDTYEATLTYPEDQPLGSINFAICAYNVAGTSPSFVYYNAVVGKPYDIPASDDFSSGYYSMNPVYTEAPGPEYESASLLFQAPVYFNEIMERSEHPAVGVGTYGDETKKSRLVFPKFSTKGGGDAIPSLRFDIWTGEFMPASITLYGRTYDLDEPVEIGSVTPGSGWNEVVFNLPAELQDKGWVEVYFDSVHESSDTYIVIYSYGYDWTTDVKAIETAGEASITMNGHCVYFNCLAGNVYTIHTVDGKLVDSGRISDNRTAVTLQSGFYVVSCGNKTAKVLIR